MEETTPEATPETTPETEATLNEGIELTSDDLLVEVIGMCLREPSMTGADILTALEQLGATEALEEARELNALLEEASSAVVPTPEPTE